MCKSAGSKHVFFGVINIPSAIKTWETQILAFDILIILIGLLLHSIKWIYLDVQGAQVSLENQDPHKTPWVVQSQGQISGNKTTGGISWNHNVSSWIVGFTSGVWYSIKTNSHLQLHQGDQGDPYLPFHPKCWSIQSNNDDTQHTNPLKACLWH